MQCKISWMGHARGSITLQRHSHHTIIINAHPVYSSRVQPYCAQLAVDVYCPSCVHFTASSPPRVVVHALYSLPLSDAVLSSPLYIACTPSSPGLSGRVLTPSSNMLLVFTVKLKLDHLSIEMGCESSTPSATSPAPISAAPARSAPSSTAPPALPPHSGVISPAGVLVSTPPPAAAGAGVAADDGAGAIASGDEVKHKPYDPPEPTALLVSRL